jgi:hypothetical protein
MRHLIITAVAVLGLVACGKTTSTDEDSTITTAMSGLWAGTGSMTLNGGSSTVCQSLALTLTYTDVDLTVSGLNAACSGTNVNQSTATFQYSGGILYYSGSPVGNITDSEVSVNFVMNGVTEMLDIALTDATHMTFTESASGTGSSLSMVGTLTQQ